VPAGATGAGVTVALIDTGVTDVAGLRNTNVILGPDFSLESQAENLRQRDTNGHGTHLAGIIAAADAAWRNGDTTRRPDRVLGVAPGANLLAIKTGAANGAVDVTQIMAALSWVIQNRATYNIRVVNLSFGTDGVQDYQIDPLSYAVEQAWKAGIVVVVAAGNDGDGATSLTNPATNPYVIAVGASEGISDNQSIAAPYSSAGGQRVPDIWAPGKSIVSLRNPGSFSDTENRPGRTGDTLVRGSGSSQAAAVVSGAVALLLQQRPALTPDQVKQLITSTADIGTGPVPARFLRIDKALGKATPNRGFRQTWPAATGTGTLDGARGSVRLIADDTPLTGDLDVFGLPWNRSAWADGTWLRDVWTGKEWTDSPWTATGWSGSTWNRSAWSTGLWKASVWTGSAWTAEGWNGRSWTGDTWVRSAWSANGWVRSAWSDAGWVRSAWSADGWVRTAWSSDAWTASGWVRSAWSEAEPG
jgi:serine protease AprX